MTEATDDELEQLREQRRRQLAESLTDASHDEDHVGESTGSNGTPAEPIHVESRAHLGTILDEHELVLVDCYADWCGPCKMMEPTLEAVAAELPLAVAKVDVDVHQDIAQELGARSIPTLVFYRDGEPAERLIGVQDRNRLEAIVEQLSD